MSFEILFQFFINGLVLSFIYSLVAIGFTLYFGVIDIIKFSHGDFLMLSSFLFLALINFLFKDNGSIYYLSSLILTFFAMAIVGFLIAKYLIYPFRNSNKINSLLMTLMLGLFVREATRLIYPNGSNPQAFFNPIQNISFDFLGVYLRLDSLLIIIFGLVIFLSLYFFISKTKLGISIRAVSQDQVTASLMGINTKRIIYITFSLGAILACFAGISNAIYYSEVNFSVGLWLGVIGFTSAVVGGLGSIWGAIIGGFLFAFLQMFGAIFFQVPAYKDVFAFFIIIIIMIIKPTGIIQESAVKRV